MIRISGRLDEYEIRVGMEKCGRGRLIGKVAGKGGGCSGVEGCAWWGFAGGLS